MEAILVSDGALTLDMRWDVLRGHPDGPRLTDAMCNERTHPFPPSEIPTGALSLADVGCVGLSRVQDVMQRFCDHTPAAWHDAIPEIACLWQTGRSC